MKDGEKPNFHKFKTENMHYSKPSDLYKDLMNQFSKEGGAYQMVDLGSAIGYLDVSISK